MFWSPGHEPFAVAECAVGAARGCSSATTCARPPRGRELAAPRRAGGARRGERAGRAVGGDAARGGRHGRGVRHDRADRQPLRAAPPSTRRGRSWRPATTHSSSYERDRQRPPRLLRARGAADRRRAAAAPGAPRHGRAPRERAPAPGRGRAPARLARVGAAVRALPALRPHRGRAALARRGFVEVLQAAGADAPVWLDTDTRISPESFDHCLLATGGVLSAVDAVAMEAYHRPDSLFALTRPPGHHTGRDRAMGFCLLNHVSIAARYAQATYGFERVAILDWDVHHGNGTQEIHWEDPSVLFVSLHQWPLYPGTGRHDEVGAGDGTGRTVNLPLPPGSGDREHLEALDRVALPIIEAFAPQLLIVSAGQDGHAADTLSGQLLSAAGFRAMAERAAALAKRLGIGLVLVHEGGYNVSTLPALDRAILGGPRRLRRRRRRPLRAGRRAGPGGLGGAPARDPRRAAPALAGAALMARPLRVLAWPGMPAPEALDEAARRLGTTMRATDGRVERGARGADGRRRPVRPRLPLRLPRRAAHRRGPAGAARPGGAAARPRRGVGGRLGPRPGVRGLGPLRVRDDGLPLRRADGRRRRGTRCSRRRRAPASGCSPRCARSSAPR